MDPYDTLTTVAELAVALVASAGIVAALTQRGAGGVASEHGVRLDVLLGSGFGTVAFALLPFFLGDALGEGPQVWAIGSALFVPYGLVVVWIQRRAIVKAIEADPGLGERESALFWQGLLYLGFPLVIGLQLLNALAWSKFGPYLAVLVWGLVGCAIGFVGLVRALVR